MKTIGSILKFIFKLLLAVVAFAALAEVFSLGHERHKNHYLVEVDLEDEE